jgi:hypothetical protein
MKSYPRLAEELILAEERALKLQNELDSLKNAQHETASQESIKFSSPRQSDLI